MDDSKQFIGTTFDNRYKIERVVGIGGMAFVYEAIDEQTGNKVALKLLKEKFSDDTRAVKRFINESKSLGLLNHTNIVKIHDISVLTQHKYIVMEYINGITLRKYMNHKRPLDWREAVEFTDQIAQALDNAHTMGIIHRDIKPQNIMIMQGGKVKVTDFGIAKMPNSESLTMVDKAIGTVYYISPEQASSRKIDARSDIYSLGVMLYEMVTGHMPFTADTPIAVIMKHMNTAPVPPTRIVPSLPKGLEQIILCAMDKNPKNRYQSAAQLIRHLRRLKMDESTVFNMSKPAQRTATSEITIKKTTIHGGEDKQHAKAAYDVDELPPVIEPKNPVRTPKPTAAPSDATTAKISKPQSIATDKHPLTSEARMQGGTAPQKPAAVKPQPTPAKPSHATAKKKTAPTNQKPTAQKKKIKLTPLSFTAKLIIIIICLLIAITVAVISLFSSPDKFESFAPVVQRASEAKAALLCLRQVLL
jgi:serine/threonine protein kinase